MKTQTIPDIYKLGLHEVKEIATGPVTYYIVRVPGGWLYHCNRLDSNAMTTVFVPYNNSHLLINPETKKPY
jgi:hypothetical protein